MNVRVQVVSFVSICCKQIKIKDKLEEKSRFTQIVTNLPLFYSDWDQKNPMQYSVKIHIKANKFISAEKKEQWSLIHCKYCMEWQCVNCHCREEVVPLYSNIERKYINRYNGCIISLSQQPTLREIARAVVVWRARYCTIDNIRQPNAHLSSVYL